MDDRQKRFMAGVPDLIKNLFKKSWEGTCSPRQAIKAKCYDCTCFQRKEVFLCESTSCPLFKYRPKIGGSTEASDELELDDEKVLGKHNNKPA